MIAVLLTILCSTSIALILKSNDVNRGDPLVLLMGNYLMAGLIGLIFVLITRDATYSLATFLFGAFLGIMFVLGFFAFAKSVNVAGTALSTVSARLSVVVPIILSIIIYNELPSKYQLFGFLFTLLTILAFYFSLRRIPGRGIRLKDYAYLLGVLAGIGFNDFCMKVFHQWRPFTDKPLFLFTIFTFAFLYTAIYIYSRGKRVDRNTFLRGAILGIPNIFSSFFLLAALSQLPGIIVYPVINIGIIMLTSLLAAIIWNERLDRAGIAAVTFGMIAIILLTL